MLHIKLGPKRSTDPRRDPMGRSWVGYDPAASPEELFAQNRGRWILNRKKLAREEFAMFSSTTDGTVKLVVRLGEPEDSVGKVALRGEILPATHPLSRQWV